jgi:hypothetical protein
MKLFSTVSREIPTALRTASNPALTRIAVPYRSVRPASPTVSGTSSRLGSSGLGFFISTKMAGKSRKEVRNATANPMLIIEPKSLTGLMLLNTSEPKPMMVVRAVYRHGHTIFLIVVETSPSWLSSGMSRSNCVYLTARWMFMEIVMISMSATKFDEITVTFQPVRPSIPITTVLA